MDWPGLLGSLAAGLAFAFGLIVIHEYGHWAVGRAFGVPADSIRVRWENPPHVALRSGEEWLAPMDSRYAEVYHAHREGVGPAWLYIAAGVIVESATALVLLGVLVALGATGAANVLASVSLLLLLAYLVGDLVISLARGGMSGDWSAMYGVQRLWTIGLAVTLLAARGLPVLWV